MKRKPIFDAVRILLGRGFSPDEVARIDSAIDAGLSELAEPRPPSPLPRHQVGEAGRALIRKWESCGRARPDGRFEAYPDPGSADGHPWTIGWGSTGADIGPGTVWTQAECDERFDRDLSAYAADVARAIGGAPTSQAQFDALTSFHYNTGRIAKATLTRLHCQGRHAEAQAEFAKWVHNDGHVLRGLVRRRAEEASLYGSTGE